MKHIHNTFARSGIALFAAALVLGQPMLLSGQDSESTNAETIEQDQVEEQQATGTDSGVGDTNAATQANGTASGETTEAAAEAEAMEWETAPRTSSRERVSIGTSLHVRSNESAREAVTIFGDSRVEGTVTREMVTIFGDAVMNGSVNREMVTILGDAIMNGSVGREMVTVLGNAEVNGPVGRELVVVFGNLKLGPDARVGSDCVTVFGRVELDPGAELDGSPIQILPWLGGLADYLRAGPLMGRPMVATSVIAWVVAGLHLVLYLLIALLLPGPVAACQQRVARNPLQSFGIGLLTMIVLAPLFFILVATGIGILLIPILGLVEFLFSAVGRAGLLQCFGSRMIGRPGDDAKGHVLLKLVLGFALVTLIYLVPILGLLFWALLRPFSLGCAVLALFGSGRRNGNGTPPPPVQSRRESPASPEAAAAVAAFAPPPQSEVPNREGADSPGGSPPPAASRPPLVTPEREDADLLQRAGFWIRTAATALDFLPMILIFAFAGRYFLLIWLTYHIAMWAWRGTTLGGIICKLRVMRIDGREMDFATSLVRGLASIFSALPLLLGFFWVGWTAERRSWHDLIAGTVIVQVPKSASLI